MDSLRFTYISETEKILASGSILPQKRRSSEKYKKGRFRVGANFLSMRKMGVRITPRNFFPISLQQGYRASIQTGVAIKKKIILSLAEEGGIIRQTRNS